MGIEFPTSDEPHRGCASRFFLLPLSQQETAMSGLFSSPKAPPPPPPPPPPVVMPLPDDEEAQRAKKRSIAAQQQRSGRASTILTDPTGDKLGG